MNRTPALIVLALAAVCAVPWLVSENGYLLRVMTLMMLFAAMAQSWNIVGGLANQISLGHAAFFGLGAYTSTILLIRVGLSPWLGVVAGMVVAAAAGVDGVNVFFRIAHPQALEAFHHGQVFLAGQAGREHTHAAQAEHRHHGAVFEFAHHMRRNAVGIEPPVKRSPQR